MKFNLTDVAFLLLVKFDSIDRIENTIMVCEYLVENFETNVYLWEIASHNNNLFCRLLPKSINYSFYIDKDQVFHRTKYINRMVESVNHKYVAIWDVDIIVPIQQVNQAVEFLRGGIEICFPYESHFYEVSRLFRNLYYDNRDIDLLMEHKCFMNELYAPHPVGGCFIANRDSYIDSGLENTEFYGWGIEDGERFLRWKTQNRKLKRVDGPLFHLTHSRGANSMLKSFDDSIIKKRILLNSGRGFLWKKN